MLGSKRAYIDGVESLVEHYATAPLSRERRASTFILGEECLPWAVVDNLTSLATPTSDEAAAARAREREDIHGSIEYCNFMTPRP